MIPKDRIIASNGNLLLLSSFKVTESEIESSRVCSNSDPRNNRNSDSCTTFPDCFLLSQLSPDSLPYIIGFDEICLSLQTTVTNQEAIAVTSISTGKEQTLEQKH